MTDVQQAVPVAQEAWRINPETPTVILTPHGRIAINWSVQQAGGEVTYDLAEQTAEMIVRAVNALPCKSGEGAEAGWIVGSADGRRFRTWMDGWSEWTDVREAATRYARRQDAEAVHMHDEDAWTVVPYTPDATQTREAETRSAIVRDLIAERRSYNEDSPTWRAFGFCIDIAEKAALKARDAA